MCGRRCAHIIVLAASSIGSGLVQCAPAGLRLIATLPCPAEPVDTLRHGDSVWLGHDLVTISSAEIIVSKSRAGEAGSCVLLFYERHAERVSNATVRVHTAIV